MCQGYGNTLGTAGDRGNPPCDYCNGTGQAVVTRLCTLCGLPVATSARRVMGWAYCNDCRDHFPRTCESLAAWIRSDQSWERWPILERLVANPAILTAARPGALHPAP
jgi:hypothetical protein